MAAPHHIEPEYDLVFAGGGTAACIAAGRLASAFPDLSILVLESGPTTKDKKEHLQPGQYFTHLMPTSSTVQFYVSKPSEHLGGRCIVIPSGRCIGGGSSVNFMVYNRPAASDFDDWETEFRNPAWSSKELIPLLQKVVLIFSPVCWFLHILVQAETYEIGVEKSTHGYDGPLKVTLGGEFFDVGREFLEVGPKTGNPLSDEGSQNRCSCE